MENMKKRSQMDARYQWKLEDIYASLEKWEEDYRKAKAAIDAAAACQGKLGTAEGLYAGISAMDAASCIVTRLFTFARMRRDEDNANTTYQALTDRAQALAVEMDASTSFMTPEMLMIGREKIEGFFAQEPRLEQYRRTIESQLRMEAHTLSPAEERLLAQAGEMATAPDTIYSMLTDADFTFGTVKNEDGVEVELTEGRYVPMLQSADRRVRKDAYETLYKRYHEFSNTIAATYAASIKKDIFFAKARGYASSREQSLFENEIPEKVYDALIEAVHRHLPAMHRYLELRKKALGVDELHFYDIYVPIIPDVDMGVEYDTACRMVTEGLAPLGEKYIEDLKHAFTDGWIDVYENQGKTSGAYSWGAYGTHPYVLLNYEKTLDNIFTLAHELGHSMHTFYSDRNQSFLNSQYPLFLAEIASTTNEAILLAKLKEKTTQKAQLMALCNYQLEQMRGTVIRQTMFAEFEREVHGMAMRGEALTEESMTAVYRRLNEEYYAGCVVDDEIAIEWMRIPHFYRAFYVYQYATGYSAAVAFSRRVLSGDEEKLQQYLGFLSAGSSEPPLEILRKAGVDMESPEPVEECLKTFEETLALLEKLMEEE